jgi:hypothetical protein
VLRESLTSGGWDQQFERVLWETERVEDAMERTYMKEPFNMDVLSERNYGFVVRTPAIQYDIGEPCVLVVTCDGFGNLHDEIKTGRAYLPSQRVTLIGEYAPGVTLHSDRLRHGPGVGALRRGGT